jgi:hypothetical protein
MLFSTPTRCRSIDSCNTQLFTSSIRWTSRLSVIVRPTFRSPGDMANGRKGLAGGLVCSGHGCDFTASRIACLGNGDGQKIRRGDCSCGMGLESGKSVDGSHSVGSVVAGMGMWRARSV